MFLNDLLERSWFTRVWVVPEMVVAKVIRLFNSLAGKAYKFPANDCCLEYLGDLWP